MANLLLVDDDSSIRNILYDLLHDSYECHTADRAEQAIQYLEVEKYDVILTDIFMPGLGGLEILKRIKSRHPTTQVIVISGAMIEDKGKLLEMGAFAFFQKPFKVEEIEDAIVRAIAYGHSIG